MSLLGKIVHHERLATNIRDPLIAPIVDPRLVGGGGLPLKPKVASRCVVEAKAASVGTRAASARSSCGVAEDPQVLQAELPKVRSASQKIAL